MAFQFLLRLLASDLPYLYELAIMDKNVEGTAISYVEK